MTTRTASRPAAAPARFDGASQLRRSMIGKIQVAKAQLAIQEDDYRQMMFDATGETSLTRCDDRQLERFIAALTKKGFKPLPKGSATKNANGAAHHPMAQKARALWISLHQLGVVHSPGEPALEAFARRQLKCDKLVWARQSDAYRLIEALKAMGLRAGWVMQGALRILPPLTLQENLCKAILVRLKAAGGAPADWALHDAAWKLAGMRSDGERAWAKSDYERLAAALGDALRPLLSQLPKGGRDA